MNFPLWGLESRAIQPGTQTLTFPGAIRGKAPVVRDAVGDGCRYRETGSRSLGLHCVDVGYGMYLCGLGSEHWALQLQTQTFTSPGAAWAKAPVVRDDPVLCFKTMFHIVQGSLKFTI